jgi:acyl-CoA thioesterase
VLGDDWRAFYAFGGATMGAAIRAMGAHVGDPDLAPISVHAMFLNPIETGALTIDVESLRAGRSVHQVAAVLSRDGAEDAAIRLQGTWGRRDDDPVTGVELQPPDVPGPDDSTVQPIVHDERFAHLPLHVHFEERPCPGWSTPQAFHTTGVSAQSAVWTRLQAGHRTGADRFEPAVLAVIADRAPGPHLGPTVSGRPDDDIPARPMVTLELAIRFIGQPVGDWMLVHGAVVEAAHRYLTTRAVIWDQHRDLVAIADQTARFASTPVT